MAAELRSLMYSPAQGRDSPKQNSKPSAHAAQTAIGYPTGNSPAARTVREQIASVAHFDTTVLVLGESGTGKELVAQQIHALSDRAAKPFVPINCGAIPAELLESELFGHERGAFTGAVSARCGRFEMANGGTLFLDEIGEMSPHMQVKLLRVLQQKSFERVGSNKTYNVDIRVIAATHRDLEEEMRANRFREDLFFRLNVFPIHVPPLRQRVHDLPFLIESFHAQLMEQGHIPPTFSPAAIEALKAYTWPGNVRELENLLERLSVMTPGARLQVSDLPQRYQTTVAAAETSGASAPGAEAFDDAELPHDLLSPIVSVGRGEIPNVTLPTEGLQLKQFITQIERDLIEQALMRSSGVTSQAARLLGLGRTTLLEKIRKLQMGNKNPSQDTASSIEG